MLQPCKNNLFRKLDKLSINGVVILCDDCAVSYCQKIKMKNVLTNGYIKRAPIRVPSNH